MKKINPNSASFLVTEDCNLACIYCFENHNKKEMTKEIARRGLEYLCNNAIKDEVNEFHAMIFGGEPFLKPDIVEEILSYGLELAKKNRIRFTASIVTNGTILTDKIREILLRYKYPCNISIQLSVDGIKEVHDMYRVTKAGKGSFDLIEKNIEGFKDIFKDNIRSLSVHGCCNRKSLPYLFQNYKFFREEWNIPRIWFMPIHSEEWVEEDVEIYEKELTKIADYILERAKIEGSTQEVDNYAPLDKCLRPDVRPNAPCGAGKNFITITSDGEIYPCHHFYFNDPEKATKIGDIWDEIDDEKRRMFLEYSNEDISCAKEMPDCDCYGCYRCIADNWVANGSILSQIRGYRCKMSFVERKIQLRIREELDNMGLLKSSKLDNQQGNNPDNPACLCDLGEPRRNEEKHTNCQCGTNNDEVIALALKTVLDKLDNMEKIQEMILKKVL